jgi:hypothetical protein
MNDNEPALGGRFLVDISLRPDWTTTLGPFEDKNARVGMLVQYRGGNYSAFIVVGRRRMIPGGHYGEVVMVIPVPDLRVDDIFELSPTGHYVVGEARVLKKLNQADWG